MGEFNYQHYAFLKLGLIIAVVAAVLGLPIGVAFALQYFPTQIVMAYGAGVLSAVVVERAWWWVRHRNVIKLSKW